MTPEERASRCIFHCEEHSELGVFRACKRCVADAIRQAVAEERERAAQVADRFADAQSVIGGSHGTGWRMAALAIAKAIRGGEAGD